MLCIGWLSDFLTKEIVANAIGWLLAPSNNLPDTVPPVGACCAFAEIKENKMNEKKSVFIKEKFMPQKSHFLILQPNKACNFVDKVTCFIGNFSITKGDRKPEMILFIHRRNAMFCVSGPERSAYPPIVF
jgi:hypothetical protein